MKYPSMSTPDQCLRMKLRKETQVFLFYSSVVQVILMEKKNHIHICVFRKLSAEDFFKKMHQGLFKCICIFPLCVILYIFCILLYPPLAYGKLNWFFSHTTSSHVFHHSLFYCGSSHCEFSSAFLYFLVLIFFMSHMDVRSPWFSTGVVHHFLSIVARLQPYFAI